MPSVTAVREAPSPSVLAVFAHPADESLACGGLLSWCTALGVRTSLLCLTHGEHAEHARLDPDGEEPTPSAVPETKAAASPLAAIRARELRAAAAVLGLDDVTLLAHEDGMLPWINAARLEQDILETIERTAADVIITFDEDGLYWHPDHIAVHERTIATIAACQAGGPALYYVSLPPGAMRAVVDHAVAVSATRESIAASPTRVLGVADADAFGAGAPPPSLVLDTGRFARQKLLALQGHRSQIRDNDALSLVTLADSPRLLGVEHYRRAEVGSAGETFLDRLAPAPEHRAR